MDKQKLKDVIKDRYGKLHGKILSVKVRAVKR